ncbi:MAG: hypothetical protein M3394_02650 [Actinomycetota bacterium]|nr:hypothetical protein [Actinomycetota bacterium]
MANPPEVTEIRVHGVDYVFRVEPTGLTDSPRDQQVNLARSGHLPWSSPQDA